MKQELEVTKYETRVYKINDKYSVECYNETNNGKEYTVFYLTDGTNKDFCVSVESWNLKDEHEEMEMAEFIFNDYCFLFNAKVNAIERYYEEESDKLTVQHGEGNQNTGLQI